MGLRSTFGQRLNEGCWHLRGKGPRRMNFGLLDWVVVVASLAVSVAFGVRAKRYVEDLDGYMVAGRKVGASLGIATFVATEIGTVAHHFGQEDSVKLEEDSHVEHATQKEDEPAEQARPA